MKKLPITKEAFEKSKYFTDKYGKLEYVSEFGKLFKTKKGKILKFKESDGDDENRYWKLISEPVAHLAAYVLKDSTLFDAQSEAQIAIKQISEALTEYYNSTRDSKKG